MARIGHDQPRSGRRGRSDERLAERRAALRRAVSDLGEVTSRFRTHLADSGHDLPPQGDRNGAATISQPSPARPPSPQRAVARGPLDGGVSATRDAAMAEARTRFEAASRQADELVRTITEAVRDETRRFEATIEASGEARFREIEVEAERRMRRAQAEADALVEQRRRRISELSDRILELGETLAGRLADADEVRGRFDLFVQALGQASDRLASESAAVRPAAAAPPVEELRSPQRGYGGASDLAEAA